MSLTELFPTVQQLLRADKLRLMQLLVVELAQEEGVPLLVAGTSTSFYYDNVKLATSGRILF